MQLRDHEGVKGKRDAYPFDPRLLKIGPNYNVRDLTTPEAREKLDALKEDIRVNGVRVPLEIRFDGADVYVTAGHRRHKVVLELIEEGEPFETVLCIHEAKGTNDAERTLNLVLSNSGEPLTTLEYGEVVRRLITYGWDEANIAKRLNKSVQTIRNYLGSAAMPTDVKALVNEGKVSATVARSAIKEHGEDFAKKLIQENIEENKKIRGKKERATPKGIKKAADRAKPKPAPQPQPEPPAQEPQPEPQSENDHDHAATPSVVDTPSPPLSVLQEHRHVADAGSKESAIDNMGLSVAPARSVLNGFYASIQPIARCFELMNFEEIADDEPVSIEITGRDAKQFSAAWLKAMGGEA